MNAVDNRVKDRATMPTIMVNSRLYRLFKGIPPLYVQPAPLAGATLNL